MIGRITGVLAVVDSNAAGPAMTGVAWFERRIGPVPPFAKVSQVHCIKHVADDVGIDSISRSGTR